MVITQRHVVASLLLVLALLIGGGLVALRLIGPVLDSGSTRLGLRPSPTTELGGTATATTKTAFPTLSAAATPTVPAQAAATATSPPTTAPPPTATPTTTVPPAPTQEPTATPKATVTVAQVCEYDLRKSVIGLDGVTIAQPKTGWDGKLNGLVSGIQVTIGQATTTFEWWGPDGVWDTLLEQTVETYDRDDGFVNLQKTFYPSGRRDLNDTVQTITLEACSEVVLFEHDLDDDRFPGMHVFFTCCPPDP